MIKKVLMVDDHKIIMDGIELFVNAIKGYQVVGKATSGKECLAKVRELNPHIILLDYYLPDHDGIALISEIHKIDKNVKVVILTSFEEPELAVRAIKAGAKGYLTKKIDEHSLARVLDGIHEGQKTWLDPNITYNVINNLHQQGNNLKADLFTEEEKLLLCLVAKGKTNSQIAQELFLTEQTVKNYLLKIYKKFGLRNRSEAASFALKNDVI